MAWKCACGKRNELYNLNCPYCGKKIPQMERNKIYIDELFVQVRECLVLVKASAPVQYVISALLDIKKDIARFLKGAKKEDLKYMIVNRLIVKRLTILTKGVKMCQIYTKTPSKRWSR